MKKNTKPVSISIADEQSRARLSRRHIQKLTKKLLSLLRVSGALHLVFVSHAKMRRLNKLFHGTDQTTDVLAFEGPEKWPTAKSKPRFIGEVVISIDRAFVNAKVFSITPQEELVRYIVHGVLHLIGETDLRPLNRMRMLGKQEKLLLKLPDFQKVFTQ